MSLRIPRSSADQRERNGVSSSTTVGSRLSIGSITKARSWSHSTIDPRPNPRTRPGRDSVIGAKHPNTRAELGSSERDHVFSNMSCYHFPMLRCRVVEDPLDQVVAILIAGDINQWDPSPITTAFTNSVKVASKELSTSNLQAFLDNLRGKLVCAVLGSIPNYVVNGTASIRWSAMLANMLNAPIAELSMRNNIDVREHLFDAWSLYHTNVSICFNRW